MSANPLPPLEALTEAIRRVALGGRELWGYDEIAAYSKYERNYVQNVITAQPAFPKPIRVLNEGRGHPRYIAGQVMQWFEDRQES
jgi:hypothetical protein